MSQDFYLPFTARSVAIPTLPQGLQIQGATDLRPTKEDRVTKQASPREPVKDEKNKDGPLQLPVGYRMANCATLNLTILNSVYSSFY